MAGPVQTLSTRHLGALAIAVATSLAALRCGGEVAPEAGGGARHAVGDGGGSDSGESAPTSEDAGANESCVALADCCAEFHGAEATQCNGVVLEGDDDACASQVSGYQSRGLCIGQ